VTEEKLAWQSKLVLLLVLPVASVDLLLAGVRWADQSAPIAIWTLGLSAVLGLVTWKLRAATPAAAATGALITASLMFSTITGSPYDPGHYDPWHTALSPILAVFVLAFAATRAGRRKKERLGTAEGRRGRSASQVAANLGLAALVASRPVQFWLLDAAWLPRHTAAQTPLFVLAVAALAEAAADTASSEIGQVLGGHPRLITSFRAVEPGSNGAISLAGTFAGLFAAAIVAGAGALALGGDRNFFYFSCTGAVFGLFFDSLLGATFEKSGWLNNDAVNFLSTASASAFALFLLAIVR